MYVCGKGKDEYLTGEATIPEKTNPKFRVWKTENHMVMSWLINSMNTNIGENFLLYGTTKEIWDAARETYSNSENTSEIFEIEATLHDLRQGDLSITQYFNILSRHWQHLDMFEIHTEVPQDTVTIGKSGRVMGTKPLPSIREAFSEVCREESRKKVMMGSQNSALSIEGSALAALEPPANTNSENRQKKGRPWCDHCRKLGHSRENCWKSHGKPADWKPSKPFNDREGSAHSIVVSEDKPTSTKTSPFTKEQLDMLQQLMSQNSLSRSKNLASTAFRIADGSLSKVVGIGSIRVTNDLNLNFVLHVPNLDYNLLSISKLTRDLHCEARFFSNLSKFQELDLGRMIGSAEMCSGLYVLKGDTPLRRQTQCKLCVV
ncbi:hypothetical protein AAG906_039074 [Vitis piasezkii]